MTVYRKSRRFGRRPGSPRRSRGLAIVETALTLPILLLMALGVVEFGRAIYQYVTLTAATRAAARYLAAHAISGSTGVVQIDAALTDQVNNIAVYGNAAGSGGAVLDGFAASGVTVSNLGGNDVGVATTYVYQPLIGSELPTFGIGPPISLAFTLQANVSLRAL